LWEVLAVPGWVEHQCCFHLQSHSAPHL
jgi:hypothetical protein